MDRERSSSSIEGAITNISHQLNEVQRQVRIIIIIIIIINIIIINITIFI